MLRHERSSLSKLGQDLLDHKILSKEEEFELIRRAQSPIDPKRAKAARDRLLLCNMKFIYQYCMKWSNDGVTADELLCDGIVGFMLGIDKFDVSKGLRLCTYAGYWVNSKISMSDLLKPLVRIPTYQKENLGVINKVKRELLEQGIPNPSVEQLAKHCELTETEIKSALDADKQFVSISQSVDESQNTLLIEDIIPDDNVEQQEELHDLQLEVSYFLGLLPPLYRIILARSYGIPAKLTLDELASQLGLSRERVRHIKNDALSALQVHAKALSQGKGEEYNIACKLKSVQGLLKTRVKPHVVANLFIDESDALQPFKTKASIDKPVKPEIPTVKQVDQIKQQENGLPFEITQKKPVANPFKNNGNGKSNGNGNGNGNGHKSKEVNLVEVPFLVNGSSVYVKGKDERNGNGNGNHSNGNGYREPKPRRINTPFGQITVRENKELEPSRKQKARQKSALRRQRRKGIDNNYTKSTISKEEVQLQLFDM